jgi:alanine dehydrogenase
MGYTDVDYSMLSPDVVVSDEDDCYRQDIVFVLRAPEGKYDRLRRGAMLVSMLHFATRPARVRMLRERGIDAISLDLIRNDDGRRLVENLRSVAWNGISAAFAALERTWPELAGPRHSTVKVLIMGAGRVGRHAVEFATKYGDDARNDTYTRAGLPGVEVVTAGRNLTGDPEYLKARLLMTDLLVDATARRDPSRALVPNLWLALLPKHAVICDLSVDPYLLDVEPPVVRGVEGIPQGNLDQWEFGPDDPAWDSLPPSIPTGERRTVVSCYSWPGVRPEPCMHVYGSQLAPLLETLVTAGGLDGINPVGKFHERALWRGSLRGWFASGEAVAHGSIPGPAGTGGGPELGQT